VRKALLPAQTARKVRKARGDMTFEKFADKMGCPMSRAYAIENRRSRPDLSDLPRWCEETGLPAEAFYPELAKVAPYLSAK
jgi:transcriptional regulator with XRE-family HTH domain